MNILDSLIQEKAMHMFCSSGEEKMTGGKYGTKFSNGLVDGFKKPNGFKGFKSDNESGDAETAAATKILPELRALVGKYGERNIFNTDEFGLWYSRAPKDTIGPAPLPGRKVEKDRVTVLICCNTNGSERAAPFMVERSVRPKCFGGTDRAGLGFDCTASGRAWMARELFFARLKRFNSWISTTP